MLPNPNGKTGIYFFKPIRMFSTHKVVLEPKSIKNWYLDTSEAVIDQEECSSVLIDYRDVCMSPILDNEAPSPEPLTIPPFTLSGTPKSEKNSPARRDTLSIFFSPCYIFPSFSKKINICTKRFSYS